MSSTIYDVAKKAGVGIATVSRVINNSPQISPKTRERVLKVIKDLKYQPHAMAQGLARKRTNTIACIVPFFMGYFYLELLKGIQQSISNFGFDLILYSVDQFDRQEEFFKRALRERKVDGVLLISMPISDKYATRFIQSNVPIVLVDSFHENLDSITIENHEGAFLATEHLIKLGHKKIGMINGNLSSIPASIRLSGFREALKKNDIFLNEKYIINAQITDDPESNVNHGFNKLVGYNSMMELLDLGEDRPTAVFISSDIQATGAIEAIREKKMKIPEDIAIIGFDGIELSEYLGLTTMKQPMFEMGNIAVEQLIKKINKEDSADKIFNKLFHTQLVVRETCGAKK